MRRAVAAAQGDWWPFLLTEADDATPFPSLQWANRNVLFSQFRVYAPHMRALRYKEPGTRLGLKE